MNSLTYQFHRAQSRLKSNRALRSPALAQSAVAPVFEQPARGDLAFYEIPTYLRKQIHRTDFDNRCRVFAYVDRVRAYIQEMAA